jgi:TolB-like protein/DNA-binding winged helix-turn-helix (wHTH) protein
MNSQSRYEFGPFRLDTANHCLLRDGQPVPLTPKVFDLLKVLLNNNGRLVEKDELLKEVWPDSFVEEGNLNRNISILRKVLGEDSSGKPYIETVPKRGYRFIASVKKKAGNGFGTIDAELVDLDSQVKDPDLLQARAERDLGPNKTLSGRRWLVLAGVVALVLGALLYVLTRRHTTVATRPEIKSIAVLPLQNLSGDPTQEYFADGMTEALISSLAQIRALRVISRTSVMSFKETKKPLPPLPEIARELKVDGVIEGSVQRENGRLKMMIQLIHGPTDTHLWARDYQHELTDLLKLQGEMARAIADEIRIQVTPEERARLAFARSIDPAAHEAYLLGRYHAWKHNEEDLKRAIGHFERTIQIEPKHAIAYADLSLAWQYRSLFGDTSLKESQSPARAAAQRALKLDARHAAAHSAVGHAKYLYDWDWTGAEKDLRRALDLEPNNADAHFYYSKLLQTLGRLPEAIYEIERARQLDPLSSVVESMFGQTLYSARRYDEAIPHLKRSIELEPRNFLACRRLANVYAQMGRYDDALACLEKLPERGRGLHSARVYARMGKRTKARQILEQLRASRPERVPAS